MRQSSSTNLFQIPEHNFKANAFVIWITFHFTLRKGIDKRLLQLMAWPYNCNCTTP